MSRKLTKVRNWLAFILFSIGALLISKPKTTEKVKAEEIEKRIKERLKDNSIIFLLMDEWYRLPTLESVKEFLRKDKTDLMKYKPTILDCDDFALRLLGNFQIPGWSDIAFGLLIGRHRQGPHAANILLTKDEIFYVEPQTDRIEPLSKKIWPKVWVIVM